MEAAIEAFHCAFGATLDQVEVEVDKKGVEERHNFMTVLGVRICNEKQQKLTLTNTGETRYPPRAQHFLPTESRVSKTSQSNKKEQTLRFNHGWGIWPCLGQL